MVRPEFVLLKVAPAWPTMPVPPGVLDWVLLSVPTQPMCPSANSTNGASGGVAPKLMLEKLVTGGGGAGDGLALLLH